MDETTEYQFLIEHATLVLHLRDGNKVACSFSGPGSTVDMTVRRELEEIFGDLITTRLIRPYPFVIELTMEHIPEFNMQFIEHGMPEPDLDNPRELT